MKKYPWPVNTMLIKKMQGAVIHLQIGKEDQLANTQFWGYWHAQSPSHTTFLKTDLNPSSGNFTSRIFI